MSPHLRNKNILFAGKMLSSSFLFFLQRSKFKHISALFPSLSLTTSASFFSLLIVMQISLAISQHLPFLSSLPETPPEHICKFAFPACRSPTERRISSNVQPLPVTQRAGLFSAVSHAIEEEEYRKARAEVSRKGMEVEGYSIEGVSVGGHETCVIIPSMNTAFDIGRCPARAVHQDFVCITHAHLDHIGGLPMYVATRALYGLKPPTVFVPPCIKEDVENLFEIHRRMGDTELNLNLVALDVGETYELRNDLVVRPFKTQHVIPSQGYVIYSVRKKLKKQYSHLKGLQIKKLKLSGVEITDTVLSPEVAFTGDTTSDFILNPRNADALRAKILITEATFLDEDPGIEHAREHGHMHLLEILEHAHWFRNKAVLLTHFSSRYKKEDIRQATLKLQTKLSGKVILSVLYIAYLPKAKREKLRKRSKKTTQQRAARVGQKRWRAKYPETETNNRS
ncbi:hypothetical protein H6P81_016638 [Aristolochia fimbriata]|uniref:Metallo-beta-lactamase domain-containing protein n=1 Tax=Aristolochia fimbriata TaxID=158543 RepID=A0AAV7E902_ARIFI|nr:hypothetical protein H6P81_016638 [Aristolochia fimbriata]